MQIDFQTIIWRIWKCIDTKVSATKVILSKFLASSCTYHFFSGFLFHRTYFTSFWIFTNNSIAHGWTAAKVSLQPCSRYFCHSFNNSLSSSSSKWRTQWSRKRTSSSVWRVYFFEDYRMFVELWIFSSFTIHFSKNAAI